MWEYTPRQMSAFLAIGDRLDRQEHAVWLALNTQAARGDPDDIKKALRKAAEE